MSKKNTSSNSTENHIDFLYEMYVDGIPLSSDDILTLKEHGRIKEEKLPKKPKKRSKPFQRDYSVKSENQIQADESVDLIVGDKDIFEQEIVSAKSYEEFLDNTADVLWDGKKNKKINRKDWLPKSTIYHEKDFVAWIDAMFDKGWEHMPNYKPFNLYRQQAYQWLAENNSLMNIHDPDEMDEMKMDEWYRSDQNSLYFCNKYGILKEGDVASGTVKYVAKPAHEIICYLFDCGYNFMGGKGRQMAFTSTMGLLALKKLILNPNYFIKFISDDEDTSQEIFRDKIVYPFGELPEWWKPNVLNSRDNLLAFGEKDDKKSGIKGSNARLTVTGSDIFAINGGSPNLVLIDEAGLIRILSRMINEGLPTMLSQDPVTLELKMTRQLVIYGTGGNMDSGGKAYERVYEACLKNWRERNFEYGIIPIFFNWKARPGATEEIYEIWKRNYYSVEGPEGEVSKVQFHQHWPTTYHDMFQTTSKTLLPPHTINEQYNKIYNMPDERRPQYGYFEPIYDKTKPMSEGTEMTWKIVGANWIPTSGKDDTRTTGAIFLHPKKWKHRYYQGTDPIYSDTGVSNMASCIWDAHFNTIAAMINFRVNDYKQCFLQVMLLGLYYDIASPVRGGVKELIEEGSGSAYREYKDNKGYFQSLVYNSELPMTLRKNQKGGIGIDNHGTRNKSIIDKMAEMGTLYGKNIFIPEYWLQMKTFVAVITDSGNESWGSIDKRHFPDDVLFAAAFAYICAISFQHYQPTSLEGEGNSGTKYKTKYVLRRNADMTLTRIPVTNKRR